jgi:hypothetical protein
MLGNLTYAQFDWADLHFGAFCQFQIHIDGFQVGSCDENKRTVDPEAVRRPGWKLSAAKSNCAF